MSGNCPPRSPFPAGNETVPVLPQADGGAAVATLPQHVQELLFAALAPAA